MKRALLACAILGLGLVAFGEEAQTKAVERLKAAAGK